MLYSQYKTVQEMSGTILIAEDDPLQSKMLSTILSKKLGYHVIETPNGKQAVDRIKASNLNEISAVLLDISMPVMDGFEALKIIHTFRPDLPVIMLTSDDDTATAVKAIKQGAHDFIIKPASPDQLHITLTNAVRLSSLTKELSLLKRDRQGTLGFHDLVGHNGGLSHAISYGKKAAMSDIPVLITGETGVGKELFARAIHGESKRAGAAFIALNCGAIPQNLVESILFGHEKGAFTGATNRTVGKFREAEGGTIFLDEIGELPLEAQVKLLRVLQQREVEPVGAGKPVKVNVRIISATNSNLHEAVKLGTFREDLFFRLNVLPIAVPALRDRPQDILPLAEYFAQRISATDSLPLRPFTSEAKHYLEQYPWPGNVRELENLVHRTLVLSDSEDITLTTLNSLHYRTEKPENTPASIHPSPLLLHVNLRHSDGTFKTMTEIEQEILIATLAHYQQNVTRASDALGMAKSTFYRKIKDATSV